jgi:hypothetical protein
MQRQGKINLVFFCVKNKKTERNFYMKNVLKRISAIIFCAVLCGFTAFANPIIDAPFNPFESADKLPVTTAETVSTTTEAVTAATAEIAVTTTIPPPTATTAPIPALIPTNVKEINENGVRKIIKTYELSAKENPEHISKSSFEMNGWEYVFFDVTKRETVDTKAREYTKIISIIPDTDDVSAIANVLAKTMPHTSGDGYSGTLKLVESSVKAEISGTAAVPFTLRETRKYDNLSSNDSSFIDKIIYDKYGRTLTLSSLQWQSNSNVHIDSNSFSDSYTAVVTYTGTGYKNVVTGYTGSAEYKGTITKTTPGKTIYTAVFVGTEIPPPTTTEPPTEPTTVTTEETTAEPEIADEPVQINLFPAAAAGGTGGIGVLFACVFFFLRMKNVKVCSFQRGSYVEIGKTRVGYKMPSIDLTPFSQKSESTDYTLIIGAFAAKILSNKSIKVIYGDKSLEHIVNSSGFKEYQFNVRF